MALQQRFPLSSLLAFRVNISASVPLTMAVNYGIHVSQQTIESVLTSHIRPHIDRNAMLIGTAKLETNTSGI